MLETKIEQLTKAIEALTAKLDTLGGATNNTLVQNSAQLELPLEIPTEEPKAEPEPKKTKAKKQPAKSVFDDQPEGPEVEPKADSKTVTAEDLKKFCLEQARETPTFKEKLSGILARYDVKTLGKLTADQVQEVAEEVGML